MAYLHQKDYSFEATQALNSFNIPERSEWKCYLFGSSKNDPGITWQPNKGQEPNWFWRKMQYLCFGNLWVKEKKD